MQQVAVSKKLAIRATYLLTICALVLSVFYPITKAFAVTTSATYGCVVGSSSACPGDSAWQIKQATGTNTNGLYWVNINGTATQVYAIMDSSMGGGGWMLAMKGTGDNNSFDYLDGAWTKSGVASVGTYGGTPSLTSANVKYPVYDSLTANQIMAIFPQVTETTTTGGAYPRATDNYGFTWAETITSLSQWTAYSGTPGENTNLSAYGTSKTGGDSYNINTNSSVAGGPNGSSGCSQGAVSLQTFFKNANRCLIRIVDPVYSNLETPYSAVGNGIFDSQVNVNFFGFNYAGSGSGGTPGQWHMVRFGFGWNENGGGVENSGDVDAGIGMYSPSNSLGATTGMHYGCCETYGQNGLAYNAATVGTAKGYALAFQLFIRNTSVSLTAANPSFTSNAGTAGGATFTLDTSTVSADTITVTDNTNTGRTLTLTQNADGSYSVGGALAGDQINVSVSYVANSGYKGTGTISLNITATTGGTTTAISIGTVNKLNNATITVTVSPSSALGTVNFYWNNRIINRCSSRPVNTGTATCTWKPMTQGQGVLTASFSPSDGVYQGSSATPKYVVVGKRTGSR